MPDRCLDGSFGVFEVVVLIDLDMKKWMSERINDWIELRTFGYTPQCGMLNGLEMRLAFSKRLFYYEKVTPKNDNGIIAA